MRRVLGMLTLLALAVPLAAGAALGCGIARADGGMGAYLNALEDAGIGGGTLRLEQLGEGTCSVLRHGVTVPASIQNLIASGLAQREAQILDYLAVLDLCPDAVAPPEAGGPSRTGGA
jgi:hypothetical protein